MAADCFRAATQLDAVNSVIDAILTSPRDLYDLIAVLAPVFTSVAESSPAYSTAADYLVSIGRLLIQKVDKRCRRHNCTFICQHD